MPLDAQVRRISWDLWGWSVGAGASGLLVPLLAADRPSFFSD